MVTPPQQYTVHWANPYVAASFEQAALLAKQDLRDPHSKVTIVNVKNESTGEEMLLDLEYDPPRALKLSLDVPPHP